MAQSGRGGIAHRDGSAAPRFARRALLPTLAVLPAIAATIDVGEVVGPASSIGVRPAAAQDEALAAGGKRSLRTDRWRLIPGATVQVSGKGFTPGGKGRLLWQADTDEQRSLGRLRADKRGRIKLSVTLPPSAAGSFTLTARIGKGKANATLTVEQPPGVSVAFGVFERSGREEAPWQDAPLQRLRSAIGRDPDIVMWYHSWMEPPTAAMFQTVARYSATPMVTWQPWLDNETGLLLRNIAGGEYDDTVARWARSLKSAPGPVLLRFAHEMNGTWYPWSAGKNGNSAEDYVAAWQHLRNVFDSEGVTNVGWVWSPNVHLDNAGFTDMASLYPGDDDVDWVGLDGYNWGDWDGHLWQTFSEVFRPSIDIVREFAPSKPLMIAETAAGADGGSKASWMRSAFFSEIPFDFPEIRAIVWFDENKERPWRFDTNGETTKAFRAAANHAYYSGSLSPDDIVTTTGARRSNRATDDADRIRDRPRKRRKRRSKR